MSEIAGGLPFFTERDDKILYGESVRDPLGLLPIWSAVGHTLIPGLASIVSRIDGIQGVIFIYACLNELPHYSESGLADDKVLRFLERLWEYHLYHYRDKSPCFGITSLSGAEFQLSTMRAGIVGTGLRQYYRGTCVNKGIMAGNLRTLSEPYASHAKGLLTPDLLVWLKKTAVKMQGLGKEKDYSVSASGEYEKLRPALERFSQGSMALWQALEKHLITDAQQQFWIQHVVSQADWDAFTIPELTVCIQGFAQQKGNQQLHEQCQRILDCEPYVQLLERVFDMAQEEGRSTITNLTERMAKTAPGNLQQICSDFQRIQFKSNRLEKLKRLAGELLQGHYGAFLSGFLQDYYASVCKERGKNPIVYIDGNDLIALKPGKTGNDWGKPLDPQHWNGYFIKPQISLYVDLLQRMGAAQ